MARAELAQRHWVEHIRHPQERLCRTAPEITPGDCRTWSVKDPATAFEELGPHCGDASQRERLSRSDSRCRTVAAERLRSAGDYHQRPSPSRRMTHSWSPLSAISARNLPIAWCSGSCMKTWTKTLRHETVVGSVPICHRWTAVVLRYSRKPGSGKPNVTARRRSLPRLARKTTASSRGGTSDRRK